MQLTARSVFEPSQLQAFVSGRIALTPAQVLTAEPLRTLAVVHASRTAIAAITQRDTSGSSPRHSSSAVQDWHRLEALGHTESC